MLSWLFWAVVFVLDIWAIASVINTNESTQTKVIWVLIIAILPVIGLIAWYFAGPKANYSR
ncbi:MAG: PLDc N-terminal domain-containing protein [Paracoccus sp. (in: a-proteobacteria)]|uniref:PLDc N-terminal domain-containing protein n=1 Tax=Paracoccus sp. TaxID=267 RepID=UPI0026E0B077|nr:PLDc N-terminal domain-containing protein [Paracoccus sp. (in: a-proteobacteria)]MDO5621014.1 PLDc N-terminal domain-containing protein [Paracoccus sp. (in: a-proteobacteria)]